MPVIFGSEVFPSKVLAEIGTGPARVTRTPCATTTCPGEPGDAEHSWAGLMRYDYRTMITGLGGQAPTLEGARRRPVAPDDADYPQ